MEDRRPLCHYCGPWNGHPDGVEMKMEVEEVGWFIFRCVCPVCKATGPGKFSPEDAIDAALRRLRPMQKPLTHDQALKVSQDMTVYPPMVFIEFRDAPWKSGFMSGQNYLSLVFGDITGTNAKHGKKYWRPWLTRPTDEERAAAKWEEEMSDK